MKFFAMMVALLAAGVAAHNTHTFTTLLDHFSPQNPIPVNFTYTENAAYFRPDGPIYIFVQDNGVLTTFLLDSGIMHDIAEDTGAVLVTASNRFFRDNIPTANASVANLRFLTVDQILADIPYLIEAVRANRVGSANSRVILFGTGLGATLAGWARQRYPHLVDAAWSSSGIYERVVHSSVPLEHLSAQIERIGGFECATDLREAYESIAYLIANRRGDSLRTGLNLCYPINYGNSYDIASFYFGTNQMLIDHIDINNNVGIHNLCDALAAKDARSAYPEMDAYIAWFRTLYSAESCLNVNINSRANEASVEDWSYIQNLNWNPTNLGAPYASRPGLWLICTQLGGWATTVNAQSFFQHAIGQDTFFRFCQSAFNDYDYSHLAGAVAAINRRFGGSDPSISNIVYSNALLDPWVSFGVHEEQRTENTHIFTLDYGRSADLFSIRDRNSPPLIEAKIRIGTIMSQWGLAAQ